MIKIRIAFPLMLLVAVLFSSRANAQTYQEVEEAFEDMVELYDNIYMLEHSMDIWIGECIQDIFNKNEECYEWMEPSEQTFFNTYIYSAYLAALDDYCDLYENSTTQTYRDGAATKKSLAAAAYFEMVQNPDIYTIGECDWRTQEAMGFINSWNSALGPILTAGDDVMETEQTAWDYLDQH